MEAVPRTAAGAPIVDLSRYPLHDLGSDAGARLVATCRRQLAADLALNLQGFCTPVVAQEMLEEIEPCTAQGLEKARITRNFASERPHEVPSHLLPPEHPRRQFSTVKAGLQLAHDQMPACAVERLFQWDALTDFIGAPTLHCSACLGGEVNAVVAGAVTGWEPMHRMADPFQANNIVWMREGESSLWHYDFSDVTVALLLEEPQEGGLFEFVDRLRDDAPDGGPNYEGVQAVLERRHPRLATFARGQGTLTVFRGVSSLHQVSAPPNPTAPSPLLSIHNRWPQRAWLFR